MFDVLTRAAVFVGIIILGWLIRRVGFFTEADHKTLVKLTIKITLPAAIVSSFAGRSIDVSMLSIALLGFLGGVVYITVGYLAGPSKDREKRSFVMMNLPGFNIGNFTLPFAQNFLGPIGVIVTGLFDAGNAFICLGGAYGMASSVKYGSGFSLKRILKALFSSVPFVCLMCVVTLNLLKISLPGPIISFANTVGNANALVSMLMIGVGFKLSGDRSQLRSIVKVLSLRYGVAAVLASLFYFVLPFELEIRQTLVILCFSPISSAVPAFTEELKGDVGLSSAINSISIVISIVIIISLLTVML